MCPAGGAYSYSQPVALHNHIELYYKDSIPVTQTTDKKRQRLYTFFILPT
jgi:hypothetical protein